MTSQTAHPVRTLLLDMAGPVAVYYAVVAAGGGVWLALLAGGVLPAASTVAGLITRRRADGTGLLILGTLAASTALSLISGSPRVLLARDGFATAAWAAYMYLSLLGRRPATFTFSRPLLEGRAYNPATRSWTRTHRSWDEVWEAEPRFRRIWRVCTVIWATAILTDAAARALMAATLPVNAVPALGAALWPVTFIVLQVITNVYFFRTGFWQLLLTTPVPAAQLAGNRAH